MTEFNPEKLERFNLGVDWGTEWNYMPRPFELIKPSEALNYLFSSGFMPGFPTVKHDYYRQVRDLIPGTLVPVTFYYCNTAYIAVAWVRRYNDKNVPEGWLKVERDHVTFYYGFYRVGCKHERMRVRWEKMFDRHDECPDCDYRASFDTSG